MFFKHFHNCFYKYLLFFVRNGVIPFLIMASMGILASVLILIEKYKTRKIFKTIIIPLQNDLDQTSNMGSSR